MLNLTFQSFRDVLIANFKYFYHFNVDLRLRNSSRKLLQDIYYDNDVLVFLFPFVPENYMHNKNYKWYDGRQLRVLGLV